MHTKLEKIFELWGILSRRRKLQFFGILVLMMFASSSEALTIGSLIPLLTVLTSQKPLEINWVIELANFFDINSKSQVLTCTTIAFCCMALISGFLRVALVFSESHYSQALGADMSSAIYSIAIRQPYSVQITRNSSEIIAAVSNKVDGVVHHFIMPILVIITAVIMIAVIVSGLAFIDSNLTFVLLIVLGGIYITTGIAAKKRLMTNGMHVNTQQSRIIKIIQEGLGGIRDILIDGTQRVFCTQFDASNRLLRRSSANIQALAASPRYIVESMGVSVIAASALIFTMSDQTFLTMMPVLGTFMFAAQRTLPLMQQVFTSWSSIKGSEEVLSDVLQMLQKPSNNTTRSEGAAPIKFERCISLKNVWYRYPHATDWALSGINLNIPKGFRIGVFGPTGGGKSTFIDVVMGLLRPTRGAISVDGSEVSDSNCEQCWFPHVAHVPQDIFLADSTIAENIAFGKIPSEIDQDMVESAAILANANYFIESFPNQYGTVVGERGSRLSGGQKQRIGIARALYKRADVLIFDEATSALDQATESAIMAAIEGLNPHITVIMVAHRLSTLANCHMLVEIVDGRIKRTGSYSELILSANEVNK